MEQELTLRAEVGSIGRADQLFYFMKGGQGPVSLTVTVTTYDYHKVINLGFNL